jgi:AcrR family transcriptional regulator
MEYSSSMGQRKTTPANRERIIQVAAKLIRERGIDNTTLADIAVAAGISKGTLYYYYSTKGDLIFDVAERHMENMTDRIFRWLESSGTDQPPRTVFRMVLNTVMHSQSRGLIHIYLIQEALTENPSLRIRFVEEYRKWRELIETGLGRIYHGKDDYGAMAQVLLSTIDGLILQRLLGVDRLSLDAVAAFFETAVPSADILTGDP